MNLRPTAPTFEQLNEQMRTRVRYEYDLTISLHREQEHPELSIPEIADRIRPSHATLVGLESHSTWAEIIEQRINNNRWAVELGVQNKWEIEQVMEAVNSQRHLEEGLRLLGNSDPSSSELRAAYQKQSDDGAEQAENAKEELQQLGDRVREILRKTDSLSLGIDPEASLDVILAQLDKESGSTYIDFYIDRWGAGFAHLYGIPPTNEAAIREKILEFLSEF